MLDASRARELILIFGFVGWGRAPPPSARSPSCERESEAQEVDDESRRRKLWFICRLNSSFKRKSDASTGIISTISDQYDKSPVKAANFAKRNCGRTFAVVSTEELKGLPDCVRYLRQIRWHTCPRSGNHTRTRTRLPNLPPHVSLGHAGVRCCREQRGAWVPQPDLTQRN